MNFLMYGMVVAAHRAVEEKKTIEENSPHKGRETYQGNLASRVHGLLCLIDHRAAKLGAWLGQKGLPHRTLANRVSRSDC